MICDLSPSAKLRRFVSYMVPVLFANFCLLGLLKLSRLAGMLAQTLTFAS